jgi:protein ImuB
MQLENLQVPEPIGRMEVSAPVTARLTVRQHDLFGDDAQAEYRELVHLINRLSSRLGAEAVVRSQLRGSAQPERGCRYVPLAGQKHMPANQLSHPTTFRASNTSALQKLKIGRLTSDQSLPRPLLLYEPPRPIELVSVAPDGPPQCVWLGRRRQNVTQHWGPERIETGWWRGPPMRRDYYRIETETGSRLWVFRRLQDGRWFLHGEFV